MKLSAFFLLTTLSASATAGEGTLVLETMGTVRARIPAFDTEIRSKVAAVVGSNLLPKPALDFEGMKLAAGCLDDGPACLTTIGETIGAKAVFLARVENSAESVRVELMLVDSTRGTFSQKLEFADAGDDTVMDVGLAAASLVETGELPTGSIVLTTKDPKLLEGAVVMLDNEPVSPDVLARVSMGRHRIVIRQSGFKEALWSGTIRPGKPSPARIELEPGPAAVTPMPVATGASPTPEIPTPETETLASASPQVPVETVQVEADSGSGPPVLGFILLGAAAVAGGVAIAQGLSVGHLESELANYCTEVDCAPDPCQAWPEACEDGDRAAMVANVSWGLAGVFAVGGILAFILSGGDEEVVSMQIGPHSARLGLAFEY